MRARAATALRAWLALLAVALAGCEREPAAPEPLVPGLAAALAAVDSVKLEQGETTLVFERDGDRWSIRDAAWRADRRWLQPLLLGLANARCDSPRTAESSRFERIGVAWPAVPGEADPANASAFARPTGRVSVTVDGRKTTVVIGYPQARGGTFVRVEGAPHSCLTAASLRLPAQVSEWFDPQLWQVPIEQLVAVGVDDADAAPLRLVRRDGRFMPDGALLALTPLPDALAAALASPRQSDRRAAVDAVPQRVLRLEAADGAVFSVALRREDDATWAKVLEAPASMAMWYEGREFRLPVDVAEPLWATREALGGG
jgi:hypothetical protein